ncbi:MAG TPA: hypothetical protein VKP65_21225 [Rhodothermales bacterium]|nr:hypothetical protein [Rhodothermales bacterium]
MPCLRLRPNTERPITIPPLWDGHAAARIAADLTAQFGRQRPAPRLHEARPYLL